MARKAAKKRKYSPSSGRDVENEMRRFKKGTAKSGPGGRGGKVWPLLRAQIDRDGARSKRQTGEKSTYPWSPSACGPRNGKHQDRGEQKFDQQHQHFFPKISNSIILRRATIG